MMRWRLLNGPARSLIADLRRLALCVEARIAHETVATRDLERNHDAVTYLEIRDFRTDFFDDSHRFMAENVAGIHERTQSLVQVQIGSADISRGDLDDRVGGFDDLRVRNRIDAYFPFALPSHCTHWDRPLIVEMLFAVTCPKALKCKQNRRGLREVLSALD